MCMWLYICIKYMCMWQYMLLSTCACDHTCIKYMYMWLYMYMCNKYIHVYTCTVVDNKKSQSSIFTLLCNNNGW